MRPFHRQVRSSCQPLSLTWKILLDPDQRINPGNRETSCEIPLGIPAEQAGNIDCRHPPSCVEGVERSVDLLENVPSIQASHRPAVLLHIQARMRVWWQVAAVCFQAASSMPLPASVTFMRMPLSVGESVGNGAADKKKYASHCGS